MVGWARMVVVLRSRAFTIGTRQTGTLVDMTLEQICKSSDWAATESVGDNSTTHDQHRQITNGLECHLLNPYMYILGTRRISQCSIRQGRNPL